MAMTRNCIHCGSNLQTLHVVDTRGLDGIEYAQAGSCDCCGGITVMKLRGEDTAVALAHIVLETPPRQGVIQTASC